MASAAKPKPQLADQDRLFEYDEEEINRMYRERPDKKDVKFFNKTKVSALAAMKMLKHSLEGVKKGRAQNNGKGMSLEVMGLMIGKPVEDGTIVIADVCALPVEGEANFVTAAEEVNIYMSQLVDTMELRRKERFVGWYHSHPFDVETEDHCFMSSTDCQTQWSSQFNMPNWTAIVVDPLRSLAKQQPQMRAFRCYPINHQPPAHLGPDGKPLGTKNWGVTPHRYYEMKMDFFMSGLGKKMVDIMSRSSLWVRVLSSSAVMEPENRLRFPDRAEAVTSKLSKAATEASAGVSARGERGSEKKSNALQEAAKEGAELAIEQCCGHASQVTKDFLFNWAYQQNQRQAKLDEAAMDVQEV